VGSKGITILITMLNPFPAIKCPKSVFFSQVFLVSSHAFPANRRRCLVVSRSELMLPPIVNAVMSLVAKNKELKEKIDKTKQATNGAVAEIGSLSMALNGTPHFAIISLIFLQNIVDVEKLYMTGTIDAAVNGGTQKYIEAFLTPEFSQNAMQNYDQVALDNVQKVLSLITYVVQCYRKLVYVLCVVWMCCR
jgi:hypothetical protein